MPACPRCHRSYDGPEVCPSCRAELDRILADRERMPAKERCAWSDCLRVRMVTRRMRMLRSDTREQVYEVTLGLCVIHRGECGSTMILDVDSGKITFPSYS